MSLNDCSAQLSCPLPVSIGMIKSGGLLLFSLLPLLATGQPRFSDDFSGDLAGWERVGAHAINIVESGDPDHGPVLEMRPDGIVYATLRESEHWGAVRIEGDVLFPGRANGYLGIMYGFVEGDGRTDFGEVYLKGNGSYLRVNPWRDGNVSRLLYEEFRTPISGDDAIVPNEWRRFMAEIEGSVIHVYIGKTSVPNVTFGLYEGDFGKIGLKPRVVGDPVWIDNVRVTSIEGLSYSGPPIPDIAYEPDSLVTDWEFVGPLAHPEPAIERGSHPDSREVMVNGRTFKWMPFRTDRRGAVVTGRVTEYVGDRPVAYFRTIVESDTDRVATFHFSTVDELSIWVNGRFEGFLYRDGYMSLPENDWNAWYDFWKNQEHSGTRDLLRLKKGLNEILIRVRNGQFASGGFFLRIEDASTGVE